MAALVVLMGLAATGVRANPATASSRDAKGSQRKVTSQPGVLPSNAKAFGKTYSELSVEWWEWALALPADDGSTEAELAGCATFLLDEFVRISTLSATVDGRRITHLRSYRTVSDLFTINPLPAPNFWALHSASLRRVVRQDKSVRLRAETR